MEKNLEEVVGEINFTDKDFIKLLKKIYLVFEKMKFSLSAIVLEPLSKIKPKNAVILCHGYGGDGKDISILAGYWRTYLPDTFLFVQTHLKSVKLAYQDFNGLI